MASQPIKIMYQTFGGDAFIGIPTEPFPINEEYQSWMRTFTVGSEAHLYEWPMVYQPVNGGTPLIKVRNLHPSKRMKRH